MRVRNYMTTEVFTVSAERKMLIAADVMNWARCRHVPVVDEDRQLVGLITHRDLLRVSLAALTSPIPVEQREHLGRLMVKDVMVTDVAVIDPDATVRAAARRMRRGKYGCLPVVDSHNRVIGILTEVDLLCILETIDLESSISR